MPHRSLSRRTFLKGAAGVAGASLIGPRIAAGRVERLAPTDRLNIAGIGVGGRGRSVIGALSSENIVALCDVDDNRAANSYEQWPDAARYTDYRRLFDQMANEIDAVAISTPDHTHAVIALAAMELGKHVFLEKPMAHSIKEAAILRDAANYYGVVTQMGNQGMAGNGVREVCEWIWSGAIGDVHTVHAYDETTNLPAMRGDGYPPEEPEDIPDHLDWDLWLGPAPHRPYHSTYAPGNWRGWWEFGNGAVGDMGVHLLNPANWALQLGHPESVEPIRQVGLTEEGAPESSVVRYDFPARGNMGPVTVYWYDGDEKPEAPEGVPQSEIDGERRSSLYIGTEGILMGYDRDPRRTMLYPDELREDHDAQPPEMLPRSPGHFEEFIQACKGGPKPMSNFDYAAPYTQWVLLGNVALRAGETIEWDGERVTNVDAANEFLHREYRDGWDLDWRR